MHIRCPHCKNAVEVVDGVEWQDISCPSCGSDLNLVNVSTTAYASQGLRKIAHFELLEEVGLGGFGSVWKARDTELDRLVAIKLPRRDQLSADELEQFLREARAAAQLRHPNIVSVHEVGRDGGTVYIVSDFIDGATLAERMKVRRFPSRDAATLLAVVAEAVHYAHTKGVIHRDLKSGNILLDADGQPHVTDFGLAKRENAEITMTVEGRVLGTPAYMSPEQARGEGHHADARSDVYSLGVVLYELLTGRLPFTGTPRMLTVQILEDEPPRPRGLDKAIPRDLETVCLKCMEKEPARRYQTANALSEDLRRFLDGRPIAARPVGRLERVWRSCKRQPLLAPLVAVVLALATIVIQGPLRHDPGSEASKSTDSTVDPIAGSTSVMATAPFATWYERPEYVKPQVTVFDPRTEIVAFSVILDCSGSMNENGLNRLNLAKDAIEAALAPIAKSGRHQVSLWLFGHQIIVPTSQAGDKTLFARLSDYTVNRSRPIVHPNDDIERVHEMAPLTVQSFNVLAAELRKPDIRPTGSTPLYKAIALALQEDDEAVIRANRNRRTQFRRHVIVITDGNNLLYREADGGTITDELTQQVLTPEEFQPSIANLRDLFRRFGNPQLDVVGFPLKKGEVYNPDLVRLATDQTKGTFVADAGTEELVTHLKRAIGMRSYQVFDTAGEQRSETAIFNDPAVVNPIPPVGENVLAKIVDENVVVKSEPFPLVRSEAIKLYLQAAGAGETLVHRRYVEQMGDPETTTSSGVLVTAHDTDSAQLSGSLDQVTFRASLQNTDETKYLTPPAEAWAEFDMPLPDGGRRTYLAYDLNLVPQRSAAVLEWTILDFPLARTVESAEMRVWWRDKSSEVRQSRVIAELRQAMEFPDLANGVTLQAQVDGTTLIVQETHAETSSPANRTSNGVPWIRIDVSLPREMVKSVKREFYPDARSAQHTFVIKGGTPTSIESAEVVLRELDFERSTDQNRGLNYATFPNVRLPKHSSN